MDNPGQVVTDFKEEVVKKKNKYTAKKKERLTKLYILVGSLLSPHLESSLFLSSYFVPTLMSTHVPAPISYPRFPLFCYLVIYPFLFLVLDPPLIYCFIICPILFFILDIPLFCCLSYTSSSYICSSFLALLCSYFLLQNCSYFVVTSCIWSVSSS